MSAYEEDFYVKENIVGYTGDLKNKPTVYFQRREKDGSITFGHITQQHDDKTNEGRELVQRRPNYEQRDDWVCEVSKGKWVFLKDFKGEEQEFDELDRLMGLKPETTKRVKDEKGKIKTFSHVNVEIYAGEIQHASRTKFTPVDDTNREILEGVLDLDDEKMKNIKSRYDGKAIQREKELQKYLTEQLSDEMPKGKVLNKAQLKGLSDLPQTENMNSKQDRQNQPRQQTRNDRSNTPTTITRPTKGVKNGF